MGDLDVVTNKYKKQIANHMLIITTENLQKM